MFSFLTLGLLLLFYWFFYYDPSRSVSTPKTPHPEDAPDFFLRFTPSHDHAFQFRSRRDVLWDHTFQDPTYWVTPHAIVAKDVCYGHTQPTFIPATGWPLYQFAKTFPDEDLWTPIEEDNLYTSYEGTPFYFSCINHHIYELNQCPSGSVFRHHQCVPVDLCTGQPDHQLLPDVFQSHTYFECRNGLAYAKTCPPDTFFYYDRCVSPKDLLFYCKQHDTPAPIKLDDWTLFECRDQEAIYTTCAPGTQLLDRLYCEPATCVGQPDYTKMPLPFDVRGPFRFAPGYQECVQGRVAQTVECDATWNKQQSQGDQLLHLPRVFDGQTCAIPRFCENVFSDDPDVLVPVHEFTKDVQNWPWAERYDRLVGYACTATGRKRRALDPGQRISKHFKAESACTPAALLPIPGLPQDYYDCADATVKACPPGEFFDGERCQPEPPLAFRYQDMPLFHFDGLEREGWMKPWEVPPAGYVPLAACPQATDVLVKAYDVCADPACEVYAFLSLIPDVSLLLPRDQQALCVYQAAERRVAKQPVTHAYTFWDQQLEGGTEDCTFGQHPRTGHWVWDRTLFATCDPAEPFVFCPSPLTERLLRDQNVYACEPPANTTLSQEANVRVPYTTNEIRRIVPPVWDGVPYHYSLNKADPNQYELPELGVDVPKGTRLNLLVDRPVWLELNYRVTLPPHVAFRYTPQRETLSSPDFRHYHVRNEHFTHLYLQLPTYRPEAHVPEFVKAYHP